MRILPFFFVSLLLLLSGCMSNAAKFQVNVGNGNPSLPVQHVKVFVDGKEQSEFLVIAPNKMAAGKPQKGNLPETMTVVWKDAEGKDFQETVRLEVNMTRPDFTGQLVLEITEKNTVTLTEVPSSGKELSVMPWAMPEAWEGSVSIPGMNDI
jgi:hypothetical protein